MENPSEPWRPAFSGALKAFPHGIGCVALVAQRKEQRFLQLRLLREELLRLMQRSLLIPL